MFKIILDGQYKDKSTSLVIINKKVEIVKFSEENYYEVF